jgi:MFS family permease
MSWHIIAFGFLFTLSSAFGQTHFLSLFNAPLREAFSLSHSGIGTLYSVATLGSAMLLPWLGRLIDDIDLRYYAGIVISGLAVAAAVMSYATTWWQLLAAFFLLRLFGQGLSSHTGFAATARWSAQGRGKSISLAGLGMPVGEAISPPLIAVLLLALSWREIWRLSALVELFAVMLLAQWLLRGISTAPPRKMSNTASTTDTDSWTRRQVLADSRFWRAAPALFSPAFIVTALLFHQHSLAAFKGVDFRLWSAAIIAYSLSSVCTSLIAGVLVDKWSGARVVRFSLLPIICACLVPINLDFVALPAVYYALMGMTVGIGVPSVNALWLEMYGAANLGAVRALAQATMVLFSAAGPIIYGLLLDANIGWSMILLLSAAWLGGSSVLLWLTPLTFRKPA